MSPGITIKCRECRIKPCKVIRFTWAGDERYSKCFMDTWNQKLLHYKTMIFVNALISKFADRLQRYCCKQWNHCDDKFLE